MLTHRFKREISTISVLLDVLIVLPEEVCEQGYTLVLCFIVKPGRLITAPCVSAKTEGESYVRNLEGTLLSYCNCWMLA